MTFLGFEVIARHLAELQTTVKEILENQRIILNSILPDDNNLSNVSFDGINIPCGSVDDVQLLEKWLQLSNNEQALVCMRDE